MTTSTENINHLDVLITASGRVRTEIRWHITVAVLVDDKGPLRDLVVLAVSGQNFIESQYWKLTVDCGVSVLKKVSRQ